MSRCLPPPARRLAIAWMVSIVPISLILACCAMSQPATAAVVVNPHDNGATPTTPPAPDVAMRTTRPPFKGTIHAITPQMSAMMRESGSWKPGCPVRFGDLRLLKVTYWGFDQRAHTGKLVVHRDWAKRLVTVFRKLYGARFAIRRMKLIDEHGASDHRSMAADNTSAFNGRYVSGTTRWSMHAYGLAIDINPVENPYVSGSHVSPEAGRKYVDRSRRAKGMIHDGDVVTRAFRSIGWKWGGDWSGTKDYQHFSSTGG